MIKKHYEMRFCGSGLVPPNCISQQWPGNQNVRNKVVQKRELCCPSN